MRLWFKLPRQVEGSSGLFPNVSLTTNQGNGRAPGSATQNGFSIRRPSMICPSYKSSVKKRSAPVEMTASRIRASRKEKLWL